VSSGPHVPFKCWSANSGGPAEAAVRVRLESRRLGGLPVGYATRGPSSIHKWNLNYMGSQFYFGPAARHLAN